MKKEDVEKYSIWLKINRQIAGPYHYVSLIYIVLFLTATVLYLLMPEASFEPYKPYYFIAFFLLFMFTMTFFFGLLLRDINRGD